MAFITIGVSLWLLTTTSTVAGLAARDPSSAVGGTSSSFDRFRVVCPADISAIYQFDPELSKKVTGSSSSNNNNKNENNYDGSSSYIWAAVYRSNNNQPSILVNTNDASSLSSSALSSNSLNVFESRAAAATDGDAASFGLIDRSTLPMAQQKPVAIACLRPSEHYKDSYVLEHMRCVLKKEITDASCDGGSEHTEALSAAIDSLLLEYLKTGLNRSQSSSSSESLRFESVIRTKGTLVSGVLLEDRGFVPVETLSRDFATHVCSLDRCLEKYAQRSIRAQAGGAARERALSIVAYLGRVDREADLKAAQKRNNNNENNMEP